MTQVVDAAIVRDYLGVDSNAGQYNATSMDNNILAAQDYLEHRTGRWFIDRPTTTFTTTTNGRAQVYIPGFRTITAVSFAGSALTIDSTAWMNIDGRVAVVYPPSPETTRSFGMLDSPAPP